MFTLIRKNEIVFKSTWTQSSVEFHQSKNQGRIAWMRVYEWLTVDAHSVMRLFRLIGKFCYVVSAE